MCFGICGNRDTLFDILGARNYLCFIRKYIGDIYCMEDIQKYPFKTFMNFNLAERLKVTADLNFRTRCNYRFL